MRSDPQRNHLPRLWDTEYFRRYRMGRVQGPRPGCRTLQNPGRERYRPGLYRGTGFEPVGGPPGNRRRLCRRYLRVWRRGLSPKKVSAMLSVDF